MVNPRPSQSRKGKKYSNDDDGDDEDDIVIQRGC